MALIILLLGFLIRFAFNKINIPALIGFLVMGIFLGPFGFNIIGVINIFSSEIRLLALIIILLRAGMGLKRDVLFKYSKVSVLMGSIPAVMEGLFITATAMVLLDFNLAQAGMLGFVLAAVSPAVIVPAMIKLNDKGYVKVPTVILAGASLDDIFAITIFSTFSSLYFNKVFSWFSLLSIPLSVGLGIIVGIGLGYLIKMFVDRVPEVFSVVLLICISYVLVELMEVINIDIAVYLSIMALAMYINDSDKSESIRDNLSSLWKIFEIYLFVLVGALVNPAIAISAGVIGIVIIVVGLVGRFIGVLISLWRSDFSTKEKVFSLLAFTPKATVQAAMGGIPLSLGVAGGDVILAVAVLSIFLTAPLGAILIDKTYERLLSK